MSHEEVIKLSKILNSLPIHNNKPKNEVFRNANGVYMKMCNFLRFDPNYTGTGLSRGGKLEEVVWNEYANNIDHLRKIAQSIVDGIETVINSDITLEDENEFPEGIILYRLHKLRERNNPLINKVKRKALEQGRLKCEVCKFDFYKTYGELGKGYIEGHNTIPISEYGNHIKARMKDIALVCPNCHKMLHRRRPWLSADELNKILNNTK